LKHEPSAQSPWATTILGLVFILVSFYLLGISFVLVLVGGISLLERTAKSVRLTDAGRAFLDNARALLQNANEAVTKARAVASAERTELHVGYSPTPTAEVLPKILRAFRRKMPNVHVKLHDWSNKDILEGI